MALPRPATAVKVTAMLEELGVNPARLIMPTKTNLDKLESLLAAAQNLLEMKKQVDRAEQELRILRAQKDLGDAVPPNGGDAGTPAVMPQVEVSV
jgi:DNA methyltransferase 1-associated protein 1